MSVLQTECVKAGPGKHGYGEMPTGVLSIYF